MGIKLTLFFSNRKQELIRLERGKMRRVLFIFIIISFIAISVPGRIEAFPGAKTIKAVGQGVTWTAKGVGKTIYWTGKGIYKVAEFFVVETFRPVKAITDKIVDVWGAPVEK